MKIPSPGGAALSRALLCCSLLMFAVALPVRSQTADTFTVPIDGPIHATAIQPDGKVVVGGQLTTFNGVARANLARINRDGTLEENFNPGANGAVFGIAVQPDGKLVIAGDFTTLGGSNRSRLGRLTPSGAVDPAFTPDADGVVTALALQPDGKIVIGGTFTNLAGAPRSRIGRLNSDGTLDATFNATANAAVYTIALQPDGKILVGGEFTGMNGAGSNYLSRLNTNGTLDTSFVATADRPVRSLAVETDNRILVGGMFLYVNGEFHNALARLLTNGLPDSTFTAEGRPGYMGDSDNLAIQSDGRFLVGGSAVGWFGYPYFSRFYSDGTRDTNFTVNIPSGVHSSAIQRDGKILQATFSTFERMTNYAGVESMIYTNSTLAWLRSGGGPEVWRTTFERSTDRTNWTMLGAGSRMPGGWRRTGVAAPGSAYFRARGYVANGLFNSSTWHVQAFMGPAIIVDHPASRTNNAGTTATFSVLADGTPSLGYRWRKNGINLFDGGNILGATNSILSISNVLHADAASYSVVVTNSFGAITSAVATLTVIDPFITSHPTNVFIDVGQTAQFGVSVMGTAAVGYQWRKNGTNYPGATASTLTLTNVPITDGGSTWQVVVTNAYEARTSSVALLTVNGAIADPLNPLPNNPVYSLAVQPDGATIVGGWFSWVGSYLRGNIIRLNPDGTVDANFLADILGDPWSSARPTVALQEDGRVLIAGGVYSANGARRFQIARFYPDGSVDPGFDPGAIGDVNAMALQADGKILVGGGFTNLGGLACNRLGRLNPDGTLDTNFVTAVTGTVNDIAVQADGKILVGGNFVTLGVNALARTNIGRLNPDGSVDNSFNPGADAMVNSLAVQRDGAILVGGIFNTLGGQPRSNIGRVSSNGAIDLGFNPSADGDVLSMVVQADGKICVGGYFTTLGGQPRSNIGRLNPNGTADPTFNPGANGLVNALALQPDGRLLAAGEFTVLGGQNRQYIGRLSGTGTAVQNLSCGPSSITWQRSGTAPEVLNAFFDVFTNGSSLVRIAGARVAGGWQATGLTLPANATIRARGWIAGSSIGSSWYAESVLGPAIIERQPLNSTNDVFTTTTFQIVATGEQPLSFRWLHDGSPLNDGTNIAGAFTSVLNLSSVTGTNIGAYQCIASNIHGSVTSLVATLTVRDPLITGHPASQALNAGQTAAFYANATGSTPLGWHWLKNGVPLGDGGNITGAQGNVLTVANVLGNDAGEYCAVATNTWGSATSSVAVLTVVDPLLVTNPVSQLVHRGGTASFGVLVRGAEPLTYQWRKDGAELPGATNAILSLTNAQAANAGNYEVVATNAYGSVTSLVATLTVNVAIPDSLNPGANSEVYAVALQPDGKVLVGGSFTNVAGQTRQRLARLNADGTLDASFNPGVNGSVWSFGVQPDGRILVGGSFTSLAGQSRTNLARLNPDGSLDAAFSPNPILNPISNSRVFALLPHSDGSILIGGVFWYVGGISRSGIARLNVDGTVDTNFIASVDGFVCALAEQLDGRILVGGAFNSLNGEPRSGLGRLHPNGTVDSSFTNVASSYIYALAEQPDGKILVGGWFTSLVGQPRSSIGRLQSDGSLDGSFNPGPDNTVYSIRLQTDGRLIVGGQFGTVGGLPQGRLAKITPDGLVEAGFNPNANGTVFSIAGQPDGALVAGGSFTSIGGQARARIARLMGISAATESLASDANSVTWLRGGATPEVARTTFETTTNGSAWTTLGGGLRVPGGWQLGGLSLPVNATLRARGFTTSGGFQSSSSWFVESIGGAPLLGSQPASRTNNAATTASFSVTGVGGPPLAYIWLKDGSPMAGGGNVAGSQTATLVLTNVMGADTGRYQVVLSNSLGSVTSIVATLTVIDPLITTPPTGQAINAGQTATFSAAAIGSMPLAYQWQLDGVPIPGATNSPLIITNAQGGDAGTYTVVVSNPFGAITSSPAPLAVNLAVPDSFNPGSRASVSQMMLQPDGRVLVAGLFGSPNSPRYLVRFNLDGTSDLSFNPSNVVAEVSSAYALGLQADGRILITGTSRQQSSLWRLNNNGAADTTFSNALSGSINGLVLQPNGSIWSGGAFSYLKPSILTNLALVQPGGQVDTNLLAGVNGVVYAVAQQADGKLLLGGSFTLINGQIATRLARFNTNGVLDTNFVATANNTVYCLVPQPDGKILVGGIFATLSGTNQNYLGRLNTNGTLDTNFHAGINGTIYSIALQADGKIVVGGNFVSVSGQNRNRLARLNPDGTPDPIFNPNANGIVYAVGVQGDGAVVVAGSFSQIAGQYRTNMARLVPTDPAVQVLEYNGNDLTWWRGGTVPEVWRTTFESSADGSSWTDLGAGERTNGGWRLANVTLPPNSQVRARGFTTGGQNNAGSWFVESSLGPSWLTSQPASRTNLAGTTASFWVSASGTPPLSYQWLNAGQPLANGGNVTGANSASLVLSNVLGGVAGFYSVVVSNSGGSVTSSAARLSVIEPIITAQPANQAGNAGQSASFVVAAIGSAPFTYQWRNNGTNISAPNSATLTLTSLSRADIAAYSVLVSTPYGSALSSNAALKVNLAMPDTLNAGAGADGQVRAIAVQADGRVVVGGSFTNLAGQPRKYIGRFNADGSLDPAFNPGADNPVNCLAVQSDARLLVGGYFQNLSGQTRTCIARLAADGSLDATFAPTVSLGGTPFVNALMVQPDGKILVGGQLGLLNGVFIPNLGRLNPDGSLDTGFSSSVNSPGIYAVALQADGRILLGGQFCNGWCYLDRLSTNGTLDSTFNLAPSASINAIVVQPDGKIIIGGAFTSLYGTTRNYLARINTNASIDAFNPGANGPVNTLALQADGKILVGGSFTTLAGQPRANLGCLNSDGSIDTAFFPSANSNVVALALQPDGAVLVGGNFTNVSGLPRAGFARLTPTDLAGQYLSSDSHSITWLRAGGTPEAWRVTFETSTDGSHWLNAGSPGRIAGGWRLSGLALSRDTVIRARGYASGGYYSSSGYFVESIARVLAPPSILSADGALGFRSGQFGFKTRAVPGQVVVIEATTDWQTWVPIQTNLVSASAGSIASADSVLFSFTDPQSSLYPHRFYRAWLYEGMPPPAIQPGGAGFQSGRFGFNLAGIVNQTVIVETSTNLMLPNWTPVSTNTLSPSPLYFSDPGSTNSSSRFYRLRWQ